MDAYAGLSGIWLSEGMAIALRPNGEQLRFERWVIDAYYQGHVTDPLLLAPLQRATQIIIGW